MKSSLIVALSLGMFATASSVYADEWDQLAVQEKIDDASMELKKAKAVGFEWRDSGKILKQASKENKAGNTEKAEKLVAKAVQQAHLAVAQAAEQRNAGPR